MIFQVQGPVIGYVLTTSVSTPHGPSQPHMAYVFRLAMCYCSYGTLSNWSVSAGNMRIVVQSLEGALKEYRKSRPGFLGSCPTIPGTDITVYSVMHEVCENLLRGARHLILEKGTWDDSYNRKNMFSYSAGFDMCINYFKNGTTELRLAAMNLLDAVIATPSSNSFSERLSALRSTAEIQGILTKLVKSPDESDSTQADARRVLALL